MILYRNILLVDDDKNDRFFFNEAMRKLDNSIQIRTAVNGIEALELLGNGTILPDLIFMDINMPRMNGMECLTALKKSPHLKDIPVLMLTTSLFGAASCFSLGAHAYLVKPLDIPALQTMLEEVLQIDFKLHSRLEFGMK